MRSTFTRILGGTILLAVASASLAATDDRVRVSKDPPTSQQRTFDPKNPPPERQKVKGDTTAFTWCNYFADWHFTYLIERTFEDSRSATVKITLTSMDVTLKLDSTIWLPDDASDSLLAHEKGHQQIGERSYRLADEIASNIAQGMMDQTFQADGPDAADAEAAARDKAGAAFIDAYLTAIRDNAQRVHDLYDQITDHGRLRNVSEDAAIKLAIERYRAQRYGSRSQSADVRN